MSAVPKLEVSGVNLGDQQAATSLPAGAKLRMLRDQMLVKPLDVVSSKLILVISHDRPTFRGTIVSIGPGCYPWRYNRDRSKRWLSKAMRPCMAGAGDIAYFEGFPYTQILIGNELHFICREEDVTGVEA